MRPAFEPTGALQPPGVNAPNGPPGCRKHEDAPIVAPEVDRGARRGSPLSGYQPAVGLSPSTGYHVQTMNRSLARQGTFPIALGDTTRYNTGERTRMRQGTNSGSGNAAEAV